MKPAGSPNVYTYSAAKLLVRELVSGYFHGQNLVKIWRLSDQMG